MKPREILPRALGRYELVLPIATGGMGVVYLGRAIGAHGFQREVAIKVLRPDREANLAKDLLREAKIAGLIRHPNVVQVIDVGDEDGEIYLVMEFIDGDSLHGLTRAVSVEEALLPLDVGLRIVLEGLAGLHAAHELRSGPGGEPLALVHRDFSPQNLLIGTDGITRLTDFGIAKIADGDRHTTAGFVKGKFSYMSPEQARSETLDRRSDVWSAAVVAWEVVAGRRLFPAGNDASTLLQIVSNDPPDPREARSDLPPAIAEAVMCGLVREAKRRCPTASAFAQRLRDAMERSDLELASDETVSRTLVGYLGKELAERQTKLRAALSRPIAGSASREVAIASREAASAEDTTAMPSSGGPRIAEPSVTVSLPRELAVSAASTEVGGYEGAARKSQSRRFGVVGAGLALAAITGVTLYVSSHTTAHETEATKPVGATSSAAELVPTSIESAAAPVTSSPTATALASTVAPETTSDPVKPPATTGGRSNVNGKTSPVKKPKCSAWERCR